MLKNNQNLGCFRHGNILDKPSSPAKQQLQRGSYETCQEGTNFINSLHVSLMVAAK